MELLLIAGSTKWFNQYIRMPMGTTYDCCILEFGGFAKVNVPLGTKCMWAILYDGDESSDNESDVSEDLNAAPRLS